jgi:hypothetical protein
MNRWDQIKQVKKYQTWLSNWGKLNPYSRINLKQHNAKFSADQKKHFKLAKYSRSFIKLMQT